MTWKAALYLLSKDFTNFIDLQSWNSLTFQKSIINKPTIIAISFISIRYSAISATVINYYGAITHMSVWATKVGMKSQTTSLSSFKKFTIQKKTHLSKQNVCQKIFSPHFYPTNSEWMAVVHKFYVYNTK